jgi:hypothetical protein
MRKRILFAILASELLALCGCSHGPVNGFFVSRGLPHAVIMAHLVESPPGVLSGTLEATSLNQNGSAVNVRDYNVVGNISSGDVSIRITGALATIAGWFGNAPVLLGTLEDGRLTLSHGADTLTLWSTSPEAYRADVASLDQEQAVFDRFNDAVQGLKGAVAYAQSVDAALHRYHVWGEQRISRQAQGRAWWIARIHGYSKCVDRIKPLAERGVPSWRWQQCVLAIDADSYFRDQSLQATLALNKTNSDEVSRLERMISTAQERNDAAGTRLKEVCEGASAQARCPALLRAWSTDEVKLLDSAKISAFRALALQVSDAVSADVDAATQGHATLVSLAAEADHLYKAAGS